MKIINFADLDGHIKSISALISGEGFLPALLIGNPRREWVPSYLFSTYVAVNKHLNFNMACVVALHNALTVYQSLEHPPEMRENLSDEDLMERENGSKLTHEPSEKEDKDNRSVALGFSEK